MIDASTPNYFPSLIGIIGVMLVLLAIFLFLLSKRRGIYAQNAFLRELSSLIGVQYHGGEARLGLKALSHFQKPITIEGNYRGHGIKITHYFRTLNQNTSRSQGAIEMLVGNPRGMSFLMYRKRFRITKVFNREIKTGNRLFDSKFTIEKANIDTVEALFDKEICNKLLKLRSELKRLGGFNLKGNQLSYVHPFPMVNKKDSEKFVHLINVMSCLADKIRDYE